MRSSLDFAQNEAFPLSSLRNEDSKTLWKDPLNSGSSEFHLLLRPSRQGPLAAGDALCDVTRALWRTRCFILSNTTQAGQPSTIKYLSESRHHKVSHSEKNLIFQIIQPRLLPNFTCDSA